MWWGISSITALFLNSAAGALPQGYLADLLPMPMGPEQFDPITDQTIHRTEQASIPSHVEHTTPSLPELTTHIAQLTADIPGVSSHPHIRPLAYLTSIPTAALQFPPHSPEDNGNDTYFGVTVTSASQNTPSPTSTGYSSPSPSPADLELNQGHAVDWRMIGIAVIAISVVGTMILVVVFFDQWWGFLCDVCGHRRKWPGGGKEELVPDWQRASWGFKVESEDLPEYPSFGSPPAMQMQEGPTTHTQSSQVEMVHRYDKNTSLNSLGVPPTWALKDNGEVLGTQDVPYGPPRRHPKIFSPSGVVDGATPYKYHSPLSRSDTQKSTATEEAYDGLAT